MTGPPALRPQSALQRRLRAAFSVHLGLKATAVFIAVVLWFVINAKEPQVQLVPVRFTPVLDSSLVLRDQPTQLGTTWKTRSRRGLCIENPEQ